MERLETDWPTVTSLACVAVAVPGHVFSLLLQDAPFVGTRARGTVRSFLRLSLRADPSFPLYGVAQIKEQDCPKWLVAQAIPEG